MQAPNAPDIRGRLVLFSVFAIALLACLSVPLAQLFRFALNSDLYSHIILIPVITGYLIYSGKRELHLEDRPNRLLALGPALFGLAGLAAFFAAPHLSWHLQAEDARSLLVASLLLALLGGAFLFLGPRTMRAIAFPIALLVFMVPFPKSVLDAITTFLQYGSTYVASSFFVLSGMSFLRNGTEFQLPGFAMEVAPECSGIHSTLVLFITSLLAGHVFLASRINRFWLTAAVLPLALIRNGFRVFTIGELCVNVSPDMINSYIHRKGGPIFFALSLIPFFLLLFFLRKRELRAKRPTVNQGQ